MPRNPSSPIPPPKWPLLLERLKTYRKGIAAPVDTVGCHRLYDPQADKETRRFQILTALMLSAQTKDEVTAVAMLRLVEAGLTPANVQRMPFSELNSYINKVGFHNIKTKHIKEVADILLEKYAGRVPEEYGQLIALPGIGPKMAHLFLQAADGKVEGIGVDTHVHRISQRFHWVPPTVKSPEDTRKYLESWLPRQEWKDINWLIVGLGQTVCAPVHPKCDECALNDLCPNAFAEGKFKSKLKRPRKQVEEIEDDVGRISPKKESSGRKVKATKR